MARYYTRATSLSGFREVAAERGADLTAAMRAVGLDPGLLSRPDEQVDIAAFCELAERCADDWELPDLWLRLAPYQHLEILGPVALLTRMESDLRGALTAIIDNLVIHSNSLVCALEEEEDIAAMVLDLHPATGPARQYLLGSLAVTKNVVEQAAGTRVDFLEASFREDERGSRSAAESWFGCPVRFEAERNALYFDRTVLDRRLERSDTAYHAIIRRYLATARHEVSGQPGDAVRAEIARQMELGTCTLENVARRLRLEPRSLQRRLKAERLVFRDLVDEWRRARALSLVTRTRLPLSQVSEAVGYADQSVFTRAFQRWYGDSPLVYRHHDNDRPAV
ncbi:AraC family transcriptional regulator [Mesorhizobium sp. L-8-3]|uniref:AraC family transcriptional regulator n=1 Tax=Mesorhizobium sp. L-8-3 TaxID=2744522 RepID=UPI001925FB7E|nr:AraC family transcriptional regulator [Mesorhizobium sp. L-8-3]BCH24011.1 HTH-type transcriptional regulator VirS [Mesorhizobium sp. L-8-3]